MLSLVGVDTAVTSASTGGTAIVNEVTVRALLVLPEASATVIVQLSYVPSLKALKVTVLVPADDAEVVELLQLPPYVIVPASFVLKE